MIFIGIDYSDYPVLLYIASAAFISCFYMPPGLFIVCPSLKYILLYYYSWNILKEMEYFKFQN